MGKVPVGGKTDHFHVHGWPAQVGRTEDEALSNINEVVRMIVQEFTEEGKPLPEGPTDDVVVAEISREEPRSALTA